MLLPYIDDIIIASSNPDSHIEHLKILFEIPNPLFLVFSTPKCQFLKDSIKFLGHMISSQGRHLDSDKVAAIKTFPVPNSHSAARRFLGMVGDYINFIKSYPKRTEAIRIISHSKEDFDGVG